jgi:ABC-type phosphate transport system permease subunit
VAPFLVIGSVLILFIFFGLVVCRLRRPFLGFGQGLFGATLAGGLSFWGAMTYLSNGHYSVATYIANGLIMICLGTLAGFFLGVGLAFWREGRERA